MISIIAAMDEKRGIGKNNDLLFRIPEDLARFKRLTRGHPVIMGRKTFESIGRPLPNRTNIIVTRNTAHVIAGVTVVHSLGEAIRVAKDTKGTDGTKETKGEIFIIGGGQIYAQAIDIADKLYLTIVEGDFGADTSFPDYSEFKKVVFEEKHESDGYKYTFLELER